MNSMDALMEAISTVHQGKAKRVDLGDTKVYRCKNVVRIDIPSPDPEKEAKSDGI